MLSQETLEYYDLNKRISSTIRGEVRITPQTLRHIENKDRNHKRNDKEIFIRSKCFLSIGEIINKSNIYQERREETKNEYIKIKGEKIEKKLLTEYFGLVGIIESKISKQKIRIKVVIKRIKGRNHAEVISVVPARQISGYNRLYFDEKKSDSIAPESFLSVSDQ